MVVMNLGMWSLLRNNRSARSTQYFKFKQMHFFLLNQRRKQKVAPSLLTISPIVWTTHLFVSVRPSIRLSICLTVCPSQIIFELLLPSLYFPVPIPNLIRIHPASILDHILCPRIPFPSCSFISPSFRLWLDLGSNFYFLLRKIYRLFFLLATSDTALPFPASFFTSRRRFFRSRYSALDVSGSRQCS